MRKATSLSAVIVFSSVVSAAPSAAPPSKAPTHRRPQPPALSERTQMLAPIQVESLTLTPIVAKADARRSPRSCSCSTRRWSKKLVRIHEVKDEDVNNLTLTNKADQPLFLLAGEVIIGGKQDRIIGKNTIVAGEEDADVPVFCVEHGRWDNTTQGVHDRECARARPPARQARTSTRQSDVWKEVAAKNELRKTKTSTDTYRKVAKQQSDGTLDEVGEAGRHRARQAPAPTEAQAGRLRGRRSTARSRPSTCSTIAGAVQEAAEASSCAATSPRRST